MNSLAISRSSVSWISFAIMFVIGTDTFIVAPLLPTLVDRFHVTTALSGWLISAYALGYAAAALLSGPFSDTRDRRTVLLWGLLAFIGMTALCGFAHGFVTMMTFRFFAGVSAAFVSPQVWASIPVLVKRDAIVRTMGAATSGLAIAQVVGIPLGAWLGSISWHWTFWGISAAAMGLWLILAKVFPSIGGRPRDARSGMMVVYSDILKNRKLKLYLFAYLVFQTGNFEAISFFGSWFHAEFGLTLTTIGLAMMILGAGFAVGALFGSHVVRRLGEYRALFLGILALIVLYGIIPTAPNVIVAVILLALVMMVAGFIFPVFMSTLQEQTEMARGTVSALANAAMYIGVTIGGAVGGVLLSGPWGFRGVAMFTILSYGISVAIYAWAGAFRDVRHYDNGRTPS